MTHGNRTNAPTIHLNPNIKGLTPSATLAINEAIAELIRQGQHILNLGLGQSPFPVPASVVEALRANSHQKDYLPVKGLGTLREAVAEHHKRKLGIHCELENVLIGPGSKELMFLLQLAYDGDLVIPSPSWVSYAPQARMIGRQVKWLPTQLENKWRLEPGELEDFCLSDPDPPRLIILNYPNNPTGHTYNKEQLRELAQVARRYSVLLLSDEIYAETHYEGKHVSIAEFYPEGTIISSGLSKWCGAGGWRLGTFTFPNSLEWLLDSMTAVASETYTSTSAPIQYAAVSAFQGGSEIETYLLHCRRILKTLGEHCTLKLNEASIRATPPEGAFYLFLDFTPVQESMYKRGITNGKLLCERLLLETAVATVPGVDFGRPDSELSLRVAYVDFDGEIALHAAKQIPHSGRLDEKFLYAYCGNVMTAIDRICQWVVDER